MSESAESYCSFSDLAVLPVSSICCLSVHEIIRRVEGWVRKVGAGGKTTQGESAESYYARGLIRGVYKQTVRRIVCRWMNAPLGVLTRIRPVRPPCVAVEGTSGYPRRPLRAFRPQARSVGVARPIISAFRARRSRETSRTTPTSYSRLLVFHLSAPLPEPPP